MKKQRRGLDRYNVLHDGWRLFLCCDGGRHIEMNVMKLLGDILTGSGLTASLVQSEVTTSGRAEGLTPLDHTTFIKAQRQLYTSFRFQHFKSTLNHLSRKTNGRTSSPSLPTRAARFPNLSIGILS